MRRIGAFLVAVVVAAATWSGAPGAPTAGAEDPEPAPGVAFVGDSIGRDARPELEQALAPYHEFSYFHAIGAGYTDYHLPRLLPEVEAPDGPDIVVAELGTGDAFWSTTVQQFETSVRRFLNQVTPHVDCVLWLEQKPAGNRAYPMINDRAHAFNRVVRRVVGPHPKATVVHYAQWTRMAGAPSPYFLADYLHLTTSGERHLADLVAAAVRGCDPALTTGPFWDVQDGFWAADAINWAAAEGLVSGYGNGSYRAVVGRFRPGVTRGQAAQMVWRRAGEPPVANGHRWRDVPRWLAPALRWGRFHQVVDGYPNGTFQPDRPVTRARLLRWLWRAAGSPTEYSGAVFSDTPPTLRKAVRWAVAEGVISGIGGRLRPGHVVDRAQVAMWLRSTHDFLQAAAPAEPAPPPPTSTVPATTVPAPPTTAPATTETPDLSAATTVP